MLYQKYLGKLFYILADLCVLFYTLTKAYRILCYTKLVFDQLPLFNPYKWPLSVVHALTNKYFLFWSKLLPVVKMGRSPIEISTLLALEILSTILNSFYYLRIYFLLQAKNFSN